MLWIAPAWILSLLMVFWLGYYIRGLAKKLVELEQMVKQKVDRKPPPDEPVSQVIDPYDEVQNAIYEREKLMKQLNPNE